MATTPRGLGVLQIEPTDHCNLACRMCAPHANAWSTVHGVPKGYMEIGMFRRIVDRLVAERLAFDHLILQWLGDPSLHPQLEDMVAYAGQRLETQIGYLRFDTNAILLGPQRVDRLLAMRNPAVPLLVVFTLDAATEATYRRVKGRDHLPKVRRNIRHLLAHRRAHPNVHVQVQFVVQPGNAHEVGQFEKYWRNQLICSGLSHGHSELMFKRLSVEGGGAGQAAADALYTEALHRAGIRPESRPGFELKVWEDRPWQADDAHAERGACPGLWYTPVIRHDGQLLMCCADLHGELKLGSVPDSGFSALWDGARAVQQRLHHLEGQFGGVCAACGGVNWYRLAPEAALATRRQASGLGLNTSGVVTRALAR